MKHLFNLLLVLITASTSFSQQTTGKIMPGESFTNRSDEVIFYMPKPKVVEMLNCETHREYDSLRIMKYKDLVLNMDMRINTCDSAITLKKLEADYWKMQLDKNDRELEKVRIDKETLISENERIRKSRIYYTLGGILATSIFYISIK